MPDFSRMFSTTKVSNGNTDLSDVSDNKRLNVLKTKKIYIFLGFLTLLTLATTALAASTLSLVIRRYKPSMNTVCSHGMLVCSIHTDDLMNHLQQMQKFADESNSTRAIHTRGFNRTFDYIYNYLTTNTNSKVQT